MAVEIVVKIFWYPRAYVNTGWWCDIIHAAKAAYTLIVLVPVMDGRKQLMPSPTYSHAGHRNAQSYSELNPRSNAFPSIALVYGPILSFISS